MSKHFTYILPLIALLAFVYFSEMVNYVIGSAGPKFSPVVSKELKLDSHLSNYFKFASIIAFQNDEKCFLFNLKSSVCSQEI